MEEEEDCHQWWQKWGLMPTEHSSGLLLLLNGMSFSDSECASVRLVRGKGTVFAPSWARMDSMERALLKELPPLPLLLLPWYAWSTWEVRFGTQAS